MIERPIACAVNRWLGAVCERWPLISPKELFINCTRETYAVCSATLHVVCSCGGSRSRAIEKASPLSSCLPLGSPMNAAIGIENKNGGHKGRNPELV